MTDHLLVLARVAREERDRAEERFRAALLAAHGAGASYRAIGRAVGLWPSVVRYTIRKGRDEWPR